MAEMAEESNRMISTMTMIDETYEFSAPRFYDFIKGETEEEVIKAELWFDSALTYAPSPCMPRIRTGRSFTVESLCSFNEADQIMQKTSESSHPKATDSNSEAKPQGEVMPAETKKQEVTPIEAKEQNSAQVSADKVIGEDDKGEGACTEETGRVCAGRAPASVKIEASDDKSNCKSSVNVGTEACTPKPTMTSRKGDLMTDSKKHQTAKKIASLVRNPSALKPRNQLQSSHAKSIKPSSVKREAIMKNPAGTPNLAQENQAIKRQKLEGGKTRQILNVKPQLLPHKSKLGLTSSTSNLCSSAANKTTKEDRKVYVREPAKPFVSMAEMMKKFESSTRDLSLPPVNTSLSHMKTRLTLTRPKDPELETAQRVRSIRVKSTAELEEEMMAKIPKFRARPLNKKMLEARTLPAIPRTTPQPPEFQEFHLETMARANQNAESASVASTELSHQNNPWKPHLTAPKSPLLQTLLRARPPRVKSSFELEQEELEKLPKFKAKPLNKKIFESKGDLGMFCNAKKHVTVPQEFHFATDERIPPSVAVVDLFDKLSLNSEPRHDNPIPRNTTPNPFHLHTEERGAEKERRLYMELRQKQLEEERARVPRANPYPYTTDYPVIPPKPEPKHCTKPEPFQLESLVRHEEEMQRETEERSRVEKEEAQKKIFKALPILKEDPIPVPEKVRKPLTQVQEFNLHVDNRAVDRAEFDQKIKEKEMMYKRYREESEVARMMEEEKALKQLRRTLVPHARPVPNFNQPFCPQKSSRETTKAKSPNLRVLQRKERRKAFNAVATAVSSAAAHMR
ncbi:protein TPX2 isoform X2 [Juglans microcarpa x Juglans regia]|uniref:protein TPX2 isoform X2 n=1 Tax=Juglans microcarpa x Juglans regia TaxID=2249226 RepID=UPI001B7E0749|nr:protein TPX2 isoform X2 [Juglans microcarpa x Juglans regia]